MRLDKLLPPTRPGGPWTLVLEGGGTLRVPEQVTAEFSLCGGMDLTPEEWERLTQAAQLQKLRESAVRLLTGRSMSTGMLRDKLTARGASPDQAEDIAAWAESLGLLNDREYARQVVRTGQRRGWGRYKIQDALYRRQVPRDCWEEALDTLSDPSEAIDTFLASRLRDPEDPKQVQRAAAALARRGFSWDVVSEGIDRAKTAWRDNQR